MTFPASPTNGQTYTNGAGTTFVFYGPLGTWRKQAGSGSGVTFTTSATAPASPHSGDEWYSTTDDALYVRVNDGTQNLWMDVSTAGTSGATLPPNGVGALTNDGIGTLSWTTIPNKAKYVTTATTAISGDRIIAGSSGGPLTITLPASPASGDYVSVIRQGTNDVTVARNGSTILSSATDVVINLNNLGACFVFLNGTWNIIKETLGS